MYHIPFEKEKYGERVGVTLETGQPLSLTEVTVLGDRSSKGKSATKPAPPKGNQRNLLFDCQNQKYISQILFQPYRI